MDNVNKQRALKLTDKLITTANQINKTFTELIVALREGGYREADPGIATLEAAQRTMHEGLENIARNTRFSILNPKE